MASLRRRRLVAVAGALAVLGALVFTTATDLQAHARDRHEHTELIAAHKKLSVSRTELKDTSYDEVLTTNHRTALQASVASTLSQLAANEKALSDNTADALFQGVNIGTLENCLGGVQSSFQQIAQHDNVLAAEDISAVSASCLTLDGGPVTASSIPSTSPIPTSSWPDPPTSPMPPTRWRGISRSSSPPT